MKEFTGTKLLGHCPVDSGQIILVDPCYVDKGFDYDEVCCSHTVLHVDIEGDEPRNVWGDHTYHNGIGGPAIAGVGVLDKAGVVTSTGWGDGVYPVYAEVVGGRVMSVTIQFDTERQREIVKHLGLE